MSVYPEVFLSDAALTERCFLGEEMYVAVRAA